MKNYGFLCTLFAIVLIAFSIPKSDADTYAPHPPLCGSDHCAAIPTPDCSKSATEPASGCPRSFQFTKPYTVSCCGKCNGDGTAKNHTMVIVDLFYYKCCDGSNNYTYVGCDFTAAMQSTGSDCVVAAPVVTPTGPD